MRESERARERRKKKKKVQQQRADGASSRGGHVLPCGRRAERRDSLGVNLQHRCRTRGARCSSILSHCSLLLPLLLRE